MGHHAAVVHLGVETEAKLGLEADRPKQANGVLTQPLPGVADESEALTANVLKAADIVENLFFMGVVVERVDGEVAAKGVLAQGAVGVVAQDQPVGLGVAVDPRVAGRRLAEGGDFDDVTPVANMGDLEPPPDQARAAEQAAHLLGRGVGRYIKVLGVGAEQKVTDAAADKPCLKTRTLELCHDIDGIGVNLLTGDVEWLGVECRGGGFRFQSAYLACRFEPERRS